MRFAFAAAIAAVTNGLQLKCHEVLPRRETAASNTYCHTAENYEHAKNCAKSKGTVQTLLEQCNDGSGSALFTIATGVERGVFPSGPYGDQLDRCEMVESDCSAMGQNLPTQFMEIWDLARTTKKSSDYDGKNPFICTSKRGPRVEYTRSKKIPPGAGRDIGTCKDLKTGVESFFWDQASLICGDIGEDAVTKGCCTVGKTITLAEALHETFDLGKLTQLAEGLAEKTEGKQKRPSRGAKKTLLAQNTGSMDKCDDNGTGVLDCPCCCAAQLGCDCDETAQECQDRINASSVDATLLGTIGHSECCANSSDLEVSSSRALLKESTLPWVDAETQNGACS